MKKPKPVFLNITWLLILFFSWAIIDSNPIIQNENFQNSTCIMEIGEDVELLLGDSTNVSVLTNCPASEIVVIVWAPTDFLSCTDCLEQYVQPLEDICYTVTINWMDGCVSSDEICLTLKSCDPAYTDNSINSITPQQISGQAEIELEIARAQFVHLEIVEDDEVLYLIWEAWLDEGLQEVDLDFTAIPTGSYELRARLYPENKYITFEKI